ncbi:MAG: TonB-dependent receptor [Lewinellaceae bacterium]|nr:TonB-dependent receptor [Lewinellaceae bacterium]
MKQLITLAFLCLASAFAWAQSGNLTGKVTDAGTGEPLIGASVYLEGASSGTVTDYEGNYSLKVPAGQQTIIVSYVGYSAVSTTVDVSPNSARSINFQLQVTRLISEEVVVSASRKAEKLTNAPATISVINAKAISELPTFNVAELLGRQRGVDYVRAGVLGIGVNARGFNSAFNAKNLQINDGRLSSLIATGLPLGALSTTVKEDVERVEVVLGPSSALYGPNAHNGLLNTITKDPRTSQGTTIALGIGNQNVMTTRLRHAMKFSDKVAFKLSAEYSQGTEFDFTDTVYYFNTAFDSPLFGGPGNGTGTKYHAEPELEMDPRYDFTSGNPKNLLSGEESPYNFSSLRGEAGLYFNVADNSDLILSYGGSKSNNIGNTNAGRNLIKDWQVHWLQARFVSPRFFAQAYYTISKTEDTYAMNQRTQNFWSFIDAGFDAQTAWDRSLNEQWFGITPEIGIPLNRGSNFKDDSRRWNAEAQYNNKISAIGLDFIVGLQYQYDIANSNGTYLLDSDGEITIGQIGGYLQLERRFGTNFKAVLAARADNHDLYGFNFIPKAALVYFNDNGAFRATFGQGIAAPTILNLEANIFGGVLLGNGAGFTLSDGTEIPGLKVEKISTFELGYKGKLSSRLFIDANAYYNISEDFLSPAINIATNGRTVVERGGQPMSEVVPGTPETGATLILTYLNFGSVNTYGFDASVNYSITDELGFNLNYSYFGYDLDENDPTNDGNQNGKVDENDLPINTPTHKIGAGLTYSGNKFFGSLFGRWVQAYDFFSGINVAAATNTSLIYAGSPVVENARVGRSFNYGPLGGFFNLDLGVGYHINDYLTVSGQVVNILNQEVREFVASPPIKPLYSLEVKINLPAIGGNK